MRPIQSFMIKDRYVSETNRDVILESICSHGFDEKDVFLRLDKGVGIGSYAFVIGEDFKKKWQTLRKSIYFEDASFFPISQEEFDNYFADVDFIDEDVGYCDIVYINTGIYRDLYGIVFDYLGDFKYVVGIKLCCENKFIELCRNDFDIRDNLFKYLKLPRRRRKK